MRRFLKMENLILSTYQNDNLIEVGGKSRQIVKLMKDSTISEAHNEVDKIS